MGSATELAMAKLYERDLRERAFHLAVRVFKLFPQMSRSGPEFSYLAKQLLRAVTSIGANLEEGQAPSSRRDMASKYSIALREARESNFWSRLGATDERWEGRLRSIATETNEFVAMLTVAVKRLRQPAQHAQDLRARGPSRVRRSRRLKPGRRTHRTL